MCVHTCVCVCVCMCVCVILCVLACVYVSMCVLDHTCSLVVAVDTSLQCGLVTSLGNDYSNIP